MKLYCVPFLLSLILRLWVLCFLQLFVVGCIASFFGKGQAGEQGEQGKSGSKETPKKPEFDINNPIFHPEEAASWATQTLLATEKQPKLQEIRNCFDEMEALATETGHYVAMREAAETLLEPIKKAIWLYHWCFYQAMRELDIILGKPGLSYDRRAEYFLKDMKKLWILAWAMDKTAGSDRYFPYLRSRYVQISSSIFGRDVLVLTPFLDEIVPNFFPEDHVQSPSEEGSHKLDLQSKPKNKEQKSVGSAEDRE